MTSRDPLARLDDIQDAIAGIRETVGDADFAAYQNSWTMRRAIERGIEIISEASRHIPDDLKAQHPELPWRAIAGIGNILRHDYQRVEDRIIWNLLQEQLGQLADVIATMRRNLEEE